MDVNPRQESGHNNDTQPIIPRERLLFAVGQIASDLGGESLEREINRLNNETPEPYLLNPEATSLLEKIDPNASKNIMELLEIMGEDAAIIRWDKSGRRLARREERPQWRRDLGRGVLKGLQATGLSFGMVVSPDMIKELFE
jgi:hypothetical protein